MNAEPWLQSLADTRALGTLLERLRAEAGPYELVHHWKQGEFHHDVVVRVLPDHRVLSEQRPDMPGEILVVATNCNGGVKEVLCFGELPSRDALWHWRCPTSPEFVGALPPVLARATTEHYFDPCELLAADARSELKPGHRRRQQGGGWEPAAACGTKPNRD